MIIIIDAGHGIETAGKRAPDGSYLEAFFSKPRGFFYFDQYEFSTWDTVADIC